MLLSRPIRLLLLCAATSLAGASAAHGAAYRTEVRADDPEGYWRLEADPPPAVGAVFHSEVEVAPGMQLRAQILGAPAASVPGAPNVSPRAHQLPGGASRLGIETFATSIPALTAEAWFRVDALPGSFAVLFDSTSDTGNAVILAITGTGELAVQSAMDGGLSMTGVTLAAGTWHHLALTRLAGGQLRLYRDGVQVWSHAAGGPLVPTLLGGSIPFHTIAGQPAGNGIAGAIDEAAIYDQELSAARIAAHHATQAGDVAPACPDTATLVPQDTAVTLTGACTDADPGDTLDYAVPSLATEQGGTLAPSGPSSLVYSPPAGFTGTDRFSYSAHDGSRGSGAATATLLVYGPEATAQDVAPGGTLTSTDGAVSVTTADGGPVVITPVAAAAPAGYELLGTSFRIEAPLADGDPLRIVLRAPVQGAESLVAFRDGVAIADCTGPGATPDPCVASRTVAAGTGTVEVLTSHASLWQLATDRPGKGCGDRNHAHAREGGCKQRR